MKVDPVIIRSSSINTVHNVRIFKCLGQTTKKTLNQLIKSRQFRPFFENQFTSTPQRFRLVEFVYCIQNTKVDLVVL